MLEEVVAALAGDVAADAAEKAERAGLAEAAAQARARAASGQWKSLFGCPRTGRAVATDPSGKALARETTSMLTALDLPPLSRCSGHPWSAMPGEAEYGPATAPVWANGGFVSALREAMCAHSSTRAYTDMVGAEAMVTHRTGVAALPPYLPHLPPLADQPAVGPLPSEGEVVSLDAEFVAVATEQRVTDAEGNVVVTERARLAPARVSVLRADGSILMDDWILPAEPVVDHLTRFSGVRAADLRPASSPHRLVSERSVALRLRALADAGVVWVGHGLRSDFAVLGLCPPAARVRDTASLFRGMDGRMPRLRALALIALGKDIQGDSAGHSSVEDAEAALQLYRLHEELSAKGPAALRDELARIDAAGAPHAAAARRAAKERERAAAMQRMGSGPAASAATAAAAAAEAAAAAAVSAATATAAAALPSRRVASGPSAVPARRGGPQRWQGADGRHHPGQRRAPPGGMWG
ncbi:hypothetical protein FNF28_05050 [Cafeteria roenbergensis]|uniref:Exonuclease domain-containing protein n=1 Tax=Cafeteria roenbergensis TaxID=33653 RepID=A0A5A8DA14_CAFRO|nr:hypothetical protein FNF28_05050 [Cafeteria roenbergensis]